MPQQDLTGIGELQALLGQGASFTGKLTFQGRIRIDGHFRGHIFSEGVLILGQGADVEATIEVGSLIIRGGHLSGDVSAKQLVEIYAPSQVSANIVSPQLFLDKGVKFEGKCSMPEEEGSSSPAPAEAEEDLASA